MAPRHSSTHSATLAAPSVRRAFILLHLLLGVGLVATGVDALFRAISDASDLDIPLAAAATTAVFGGILFLVPRTMRVGGALLLVVVLAVLMDQMIHGQWRLEFALYAAAILFVTLHGAAWGTNRGHPDSAAQVQRPAAADPAP